MTPAELAQLAHISQARQDADAARLRSINAEERGIRAKLSALDTTRDSARNLPTIDTLPQRRVGGDLLWEVWVGRRRRELQMQLALCLARKGNAKRQLQSSFGKNSALNSLTSDLQAREDHARKIQAFEKMTEISVLRQAH